MKPLRHVYHKTRTSQVSSIHGLVGLVDKVYAVKKKTKNKNKPWHPTVKDYDTHCKKKERHPPPFPFAVEKKWTDTHQLTHPL